MTNEYQPTPEEVNERYRQETMTDTAKPENPLAFPQPLYPNGRGEFLPIAAFSPETGMTLRDLFAAAFLVGVPARSMSRDAAEQAYRQADAMLEVRAETEGGTE